MVMLVRAPLADGRQEESVQTCFVRVCGAFDLPARPGRACRRAGGMPYRPGRHRAREWRCSPWGRCAWRPSTGRRPYGRGARKRGAHKVPPCGSPTCPARPL